MCWQESEKYIYMGKNSGKRCPKWGQPQGKSPRGPELRAQSLRPPPGVPEVTSTVPGLPLPTYSQVGLWVGWGGGLVVEAENVRTQWL